MNLNFCQKKKKKTSLRIVFLLQEHFGVFLHIALDGSEQLDESGHVVESDIN